MSKRIKILISAYACEPNLGSEIGVGWHWVVEMSRYFDLWVLTRESNRESIERWFSTNRLDNKPTFIYYDLPKKWRFWKRGLRGVRLYYLLWQRLTDKIVRETMTENHIEIYHHLTYGNALWSVSKYGQRQIFIWGPTSVGTYVPSEFTRHYGFKNRIKEALQRLMAQTLTFNVGFNRRCRDAQIILCKTEQTRECIPAKYRSKATLFTDVAIDPLDTSKYTTNKSPDKITHYLAVGRLESWRGFDLMIEAFVKALQHNNNLHLDILGDGTDRKRLERLIRRLHLTDHISMRGQVTMEDYYRYMAECDVVVNPTLKEGAVTTAFDSMSFAKPIIAIDTGGYTRYFTDEYAILLSIDSRPKTIDNLASAMVRLSGRTLREKMSARIISVRDSFVWRRKGEQIRDIILQSING